MAGTKKLKVFLDASVLVAASASVTGASAYVLHLSRAGKIKALICEEVLGEATKNVEQKLNEAGKRRLQIYLKLAGLVSVSSPSPETVKTCEAVIHAKDAPILAAAIVSKADVLLTLDRKHFLNKKVTYFAKPMKVMAPGDWLRLQGRTLQANSL